LAIAKSLIALLNINFLFYGKTSYAEGNACYKDQYIPDVQLFFGALFSVASERESFRTPRI